MKDNLDLLLDEEFTSNPNDKKKRSVYLLVLCILTWVGCAAYVAAFGFASVVLNKEANYEWNYQSDWYHYAITFSNLGILSGVVCAGSAVLIFFRYRFAFFVYLFAQLLPPIYMLINHYEMSIRREEEYIAMGIYILSTLIFPVLYSFAYKYIRR